MLAVTIMINNTMNNDKKFKNTVMFMSVKRGN